MANIIALPPSLLTPSPFFIIKNIDTVKVVVEAAGRWFASLTRRRRLNLPLSHCDDGELQSQDQGFFSFLFSIFHNELLVYPSVILL